MKVTLIEAGQQVMRTMDPDMAAPIASALRQLGIDVRLGVQALGFEDGFVETDAGPLRADLVVLGLGVAPNTGLAADAGITTGVRGAIRVNRRQQTSAPGVYAAADCAESSHRDTQRPVPLTLGTE